jgi:hypothetical protein
MTIFIDADTINDLTSFSGLNLALASWLEREDLDARIPDFIRLAEARFRRELVMPDMETQVSVTPAATVTLPTDFDSIRAFGITGYAPFIQRTPADFYANVTNPDGTPATGQPTQFAIVAGKFAFWPVPDTAYSALLTYRACLPSLSLSNQTNWLLVQHPDAYLFGALLQAEFHGWNDERLPLIKAELDDILSQITVSGTRKRYGSGPLTMKPPVNERVGLR